MNPEHLYVFCIVIIALFCLILGAVIGVMIFDRCVERDLDEIKTRVDNASNTLKQIMTTVNQMNRRL